MNKDKKFVAVALQSIYLCEDNILGNRNVKVFESKKHCIKGIKQLQKNNEIAKNLNFIIMDVEYESKN